MNNSKCLLRKIYTNFTRIVIGIYIIIDTFVNLCAKSIQNVSMYIASCIAVLQYEEPYPEINTKFNKIVIGIYIIIDTFVNLCAKSIQNVSIYIASCSEFIYSKVASFLWLQINITLWHLSAKSDTTPPSSSWSLTFLHHFDHISWNKPITGAIMQASHLILFIYLIFYKRTQYSKIKK